jgi:trehalose 6-phosphate phosphatase
MSGRAALLSLLRELARSPMLVALDFDGTLAPIVRDHERASMRPRTKALLAEVADLYPTVIVSGRAISDLRGRLGGVRVRCVIGSHGAEPSPGMNPAARLMRGVRRRIAGRLARVTGISIEDKHYSIAVHYRHAATPALARARILAALGEETGIRLISGKSVVNVVSIDAPGKGQAVLALRKRFGVDKVLFVGDDITDEDVFALTDPGVIGVRIGSRRRSAARFALSTQREIDDLLGCLVKARGGDATAAPVSRTSRSR